MNLGSLKTRLKKLEPKQLADHWFGEIHLNDCRTFNREGTKNIGRWRIFGKDNGLPCCFESGYYSSFDEAMDLIKKAFRKYTLAVCDIFYLETTTDDKLELHTVYAFENSKITDKFPKGGLEELVPDNEGGDFQKMSDIEFIAFFNKVF